MLHSGLDLSRKRLDFHALDESGQALAVDAAAPDADGWPRSRAGSPAHRCEPRSSR